MERLGKWMDGCDSTHKMAAPGSITWPLFPYFEQSNQQWGNSATIASKFWKHKVAESLRLIFRPKHGKTTFLC
jgi:hypothetical protein